MQEVQKTPSDSVRPDDERALAILKGSGISGVDRGNIASVYAGDFSAELANGTSPLVVGAFHTLWATFLDDKVRAAAKEALTLSVPPRKPLSREGVFDLGAAKLTPFVGSGILGPGVGPIPRVNVALGNDSNRTIVVPINHPHPSKDDQEYLLQLYEESTFPGGLARTANLQDYRSKGSWASTRKAVEAFMASNPTYAVRLLLRRTPTDLPRGTGQPDTVGYIVLPGYGVLQFEQVVPVLQRVQRGIAGKPNANTHYSFTAWAND